MTEITDVLRECWAGENCYICFKEFDNAEDKKVIDHCHYTGLYQGAGHKNWNLKYWIAHHISIEFHKLIGYDAPLFLKERGKKFKRDDTGVIAGNKEKYNSFNVKNNVKLVGVKTIKKYLRIFSWGL